ncbi:MAG: class I SAM-dependent methyltransferase [Alphaproteobacteria bacterium]|nr:class I SAM-dependent methyltransferase [Alphaproteobacteria bacterium]
MSIEQSVVRHYEHGSLEKALLAAVSSTGKDTTGALAHTDLSAFDEFHIGGRQATTEFSTQIDLPRGAHVLDIGSGLGGPSRFFAAERGWKIDGIDLTPEYVAVATALSQKAGLADAVTYRVANAARLPFADASFDGAYMLHVGMNIPDKKSMFVEVRRVLKAGGLFAIYDIFRESDGAFVYPVPWSSAPETNFIDTTASYKKLLADAGFTLDKERPRRDFALASFKQARERAAQGGPPTGIAMGSTAPQKMANLAKLVADGVAAPSELISRVA